MGAASYIRQLLIRIKNHKKIKTELPYDLAIVLLGISHKDKNVVKRRAICTPIVITAMATVTKLWKEPNALQWTNG